MRRLLVLVALLSGACGGGAVERPTPSTTSPPPVVTTTSSTVPPTPPTTSPWVLGATPLPLGADGTPLPQETPPQLRDRRLTAPDVLPPPTDDTFHSVVRRIDELIAGRMGNTWQPGCPVPLAALRYLELTFRGFDGKAHTGELIVSAAEADSIVSVFRKLFAAGFPIEEMRIPGTADVNAAPTGDGNDTAGFICRPTRGSTSNSAHAYGLAVDVNPFQNPYVKGDVVLPELARAYTDRTRALPGMITRGDVVTKAFADIGWKWGGAYTSLKDTMHFSATGR